MLNPLSTAPAAIALLSLANLASAAQKASPNVVAFDVHRRTDLPAFTPFGLRKRSNDVSEDLTWGSLLYYINITLGSPGQSSAVWIDTGSSDLWVPDLQSGICESNQYGCSNNGGFDSTQSKSYEVVSQGNFEISYASGDSIKGDYGSDTLTFSNGDDVKVTSMIFGVAESGKTTTPLNGIMGVGYEEGESIASQGTTYPNIITQLWEQGHINSRAYSLYLNDLENGHGIILFGGVDTAKYSGELAVLDVQKNEQTNEFDTFTVVLSSLSFTTGGSTSDIDLNGGLAVILDSGTTLTYLPNDIAQSVYDGLGVENNPDAGPIIACNADTSGMKFTFTFGSSSGKAIDVDLAQFVIPYDMQLGLPANTCQFGIYQTGTVSNGQGDILFGDTFLRSAYVVYDLDNNQIGISQTKFDTTDSSIEDIGKMGSGAGVASLSSIPTITNTIPGATTVTGADVISQTVSGIVQPTEPFVGGGAASTTVESLASATSHSATFKGLTGGLKTASGSSSSSTSSSASSALQVPAADFMSAIVFGIASLGVLFGSSIFLLIGV